MHSSDRNALFPSVDPAAIDWRPVLDRFHEGVIVTDADGVVLYMNDRQARVDDLDAGDAVGRAVTALYRVDDGTSPVMQCLQTGRTIANRACYYRTHLGRVVNSIHHVHPIRAQGRVVGAVCVIIDYQNVARSFTAAGPWRPSEGGRQRGKMNAVDRRRRAGNGARYRFNDIVGRDGDLLAALKAAQLSSTSPSPVMISGESGTGKEMVAQSIHNASPSRPGPYIAVNCAAIPENLLEGMLFGTTRGAFTGAIDKAGLLETAHGGTLFLDEVNAMSPGLQAKLLRFLQERKVRRVGAVKEIDVALKIVSSVNVPPHEAIASGRLRADLFYRLAVVFTHLPPLRERRGDVDRLAAHFLAQCNRRLGKRVAGIDRRLLQRFREYDWPGNVRELAHVIEGAMNMVGEDDILMKRHLSVPRPLTAGRGSVPPPSERSIRRDNGAVGRAAAASRGAAGDGLIAMHATNETAAIVAALTATRGNAAGAARRLGISPQLMHYKLKRLGIDRRDFKG